MPTVFQIIAHPGPLPTFAPWSEPADRPRRGGECYKAGFRPGSPEQEWAQLWVHCFPADLNMDDGAPWWLIGTTAVHTSSTLGVQVFKAHAGSGRTRQVHRMIKSWCSMRSGTRGPGAQVGEAPACWLCRKTATVLQLSPAKRHTRPGSMHFALIIMESSQS